MKNASNAIEKVSGRVIAIERKRKNYNVLFIDSRIYGKMLVKAVLPDADVADLRMNDEVLLSGKLRIRKRCFDDGTVVRNVLVMKPTVQHIIRTKKVAEWSNE